MPDQILDKAEMPWEEFEFQNRLFWRMHFASTFAIVTLLTVSFLFGATASAAEICLLS